MKIPFAAFGLVCLSSLCAFGCSGEGTAEPTDSIDQAFHVFSCANATRDVNLNGTLPQIAGVSTPTTYDNPGCSDGYIVEFDGTVNGVHYGYRPQTTRIGSNDGIHVDFRVFKTSPGAANDTYCVDHYGGQAILYEKQSDGTWLEKESYVQHSHSNLTFSECTIASKIFHNLIKGTASEPHIYRVAVYGHNIVTAPDTGWGPVSIYACDVNNPC